MRRKTHEEFMIEFQKKGNPNVIILGKYIDNKTKILVKCKIDGYEWYSKPTNLLYGTGCPVCAGKIVVPNLNSIAAIRPDLIKYFENPEDAYLISPRSHKRKNLKCPDCGHVRSMRMDDLYIYGFNCQICGEYISYPNRIIRSVMQQLDSNLDFLQYEWQPKWANKKRYDVYFVMNNKYYTIEMQGRQHYESGYYNDGCVEQAIECDKIKAQLAIEHNINHIIIDARISDANFIFNNIQNSILSNIFNLSIINWDKCKEDATKNIIKQVCIEYSQSDDILISNLAKLYKVSKNTIISYLKIGNEIGWCKYTPEQSIKKRLKRVSKAVNVFDSNRKLLFYYNSILMCSQDLSKKYNCNFSYTSIKRRCDGLDTLYKGFFFEYA